MSNLPKNIKKIYEEYFENYDNEKYFKDKDKNDMTLTLIALTAHRAVMDINHQDCKEIDSIIQTY